MATHSANTILCMILHSRACRLAAKTLLLQDVCDVPALARHTSVQILVRAGVRNGAKGALGIVAEGSRGAVRTRGRKASEKLGLAAG